MKRWPEAASAAFREGSERARELTPLWWRFPSGKTGREFEHWRETDHDDLVLAAALACWGAAGRRGRRALGIIR